jgi:hypothetical protein
MITFRTHATSFLRRSSFIAGELYGKRIFTAFTVGSFVTVRYSLPHDSRTSTTAGSLFKAISATRETVLDQGADVDEKAQDDERQAG